MCWLAEISVEQLILQFQSNQLWLFRWKSRTLMQISQGGAFDCMQMRWSWPDHVIKLFPSLWFLFKWARSSPDRCNGSQLCKWARVIIHITLDHCVGKSLWRHWSVTSHSPRDRQWRHQSDVTRTLLICLWSLSLKSRDIIMWPTQFVMEGGGGRPPRR